MGTVTLIVGALLVAIAIIVIVRKKPGRSVPDHLRRGESLPEFSAVDESGAAVSSRELQGQASVLLFVRGTWCPFCSAQVESLTRYYKDIVDLGARLVLVTPKPLETTRRVAAFFDVDFDFWLDEGLASARQLGLLLEGGVHDEYRDEYGADTLWPTAVVTDAEGTIVYVNLSKTLRDRPDPKELLNAVRKASGR